VLYGTPSVSACPSLKNSGAAKGISEAQHGWIHSLLVAETIREAKSLNDRTFHNVLSEWLTNFA
jgi:hypothetical protein